MRKLRVLLLIALVGALILVGTLFAGAASAAPAPQQTQFHMQINGISAVQLSWWFQHIADKNGAYWNKLSSSNKDIYWVVTPEDNAHNVIGSLWTSDQKVAGGLFPNDKLHMQVQYVDYNTIRSPGGTGTPYTAALDPALPFPSDYSSPYPTPLNVATDVNGFNEDMLFFDGHGFCPGRILWSWKNTGGDDTAATAGQAPSIDLYCTFYLPYMEGANLPPEMSTAGYFYTSAQVTAIWNLWQQELTKLPTYLPGWFGTNTQDTLARAKGWTVVSVIDTGVQPGVTSKMEVWWWMHGMGDDPGNGYVFWCPPAHHTIRWLPGYSPADLAKADGLKKVPTDYVLPGIIYPDLQGAATSGLVQTGGGMMAYRLSDCPIPGVYKTLDPMQPVTLAEVQNFANDRFPARVSFLMHQWENVPGGLLHRSTSIRTLPLATPLTQSGFYSEHQELEGLFAGSGFLVTLYNQWLQQQHNK